MPDLAWLLLLIPIGFFVLLFCVARFERRRTWPFLPADSGDAGTTDSRAGRHLPVAAQASDYVLAMGGEAEAAGFAHCGFLVHEKAPRIQIIAGVWLSADRRILLISGSGTVLSAQQYQSILYTPLADGRYLVTTDNNDEGDQSGLCLTRRLLNVPLAQLLRYHLKRMDGALVASHGLPAGDGIEALRTIYRQRTQRIIERGRGYYLDPHHEEWRYTTRGALGCCLDFFPQFANALFVQPWRVFRRPIASTALRPLRLAAQGASISTSASASPSHDTGCEPQ